jgi:uncharacterized protein (TIGR00661 family)
MNTDIGLILKPDTLYIDKVKLFRALKRFINEWDTLIPKEKEWLLLNEIDIVISDIVPFVFKSARLANVKSIFVSNFTWVEIYKELFEEKIYEDYLHCYQEADLALIYPLAGNIKEYFKFAIEVGLSCREFNVKNVQNIKDIYSMPIIFMSVGGSVRLEAKIDVEGLPFQFIFTEGIKLVGKNAELLPTNVENTQDYIAAADYIITKAGWTTVAEAICAQKPMLVLRRDELFEDRTTLKNVLDLGIALPVRIEEITAHCLTKLINQLQIKRENYKYISDRYYNSSSQIQKLILKCLFQGAINIGKE